MKKRAKTSSGSKLHFKLFKGRKTLFAFIAASLFLFVVYFLLNQFNVSADSTAPSIGPIIKGNVSGMTDGASYSGYVSNTSGPDSFCTEMKGFKCAVHQAVGLDGDKNPAKAPSYYIVGIAMPGIKNQAQKNALNQSYGSIGDMKNALSKYNLADIAVAKCTRDSKIVNCQQYWSMNNRFFWGVPAKIDDKTPDTPFFVDNKGVERLNIYLMPRSQSANNKGLMGYFQIYEIQPSQASNTTKKSLIEETDSTKQNPVSVIPAISTNKTSTSSTKFSSLQFCSSRTYNKSSGVLSNKLEQKAKLVDIDGNPIKTAITVDLVGETCTMADDSSSGKCKTYKDENKKYPTITVESDANGEFIIPFDIVKLTVEKRSWNCSRKPQDKLYVGTKLDDKTTIQMKKIVLTIGKKKKTVTFKYPLKATAENIGTYELPQINWKIRQ